MAALATHDMSIEKILQNRDCGELRISFSTNWEYPLSQILSGFGLFPEPGNLKEVSTKEAKEIVETLLWKDLAYSGEIMPLEAAREYTEYLITDVVPQGSQYYTNALWQKYHGASSFDFTPFTKSTFDGGIIAVSKKMSFLFWVEDED